MKNAPTELFEESSAAASYRGLRRSDRFDILRSWKHDVILLMQAAAESTVNDITYNLEDIDKALSSKIFDVD